MSLTLRTDFGCTEAVIDDDCGLKRFYEVASILSDDLDIQFTQKTDDFDSVMWDFLYKGHILTLHYNIYTGISIYPRKFREAPRKDNDAVVEVEKFLEKQINDQYGKTVYVVRLYIVVFFNRIENSTITDVTTSILMRPSSRAFFIAQPGSLTCKNNC